MGKSKEMIKFLNYLLERDDFDKRANYIEIERYLNYSLERNLLSTQEEKFAEYILNLPKFRKGRIENFDLLFEEFLAKNKTDLER